VVRDKLFLRGRIDFNLKTLKTALWEKEHVNGLI
jgi:hypothetical protein